MSAASPASDSPLYDWHAGHGAKIVDFADALPEADFLNAVLTEVVFRGCDLKSAVFHGTRASGADLRGCTLDDLRIGPADLAGAVIDPIQLVALARRLAANQGIVVRALEDDGVA